MKKGEFCVLNTPYSRAEYEELVPRIIAKMTSDGEWGEYFPPTLSPYGYNESIAQDYFPLTRSEAISSGFTWSDYTAPRPRGKAEIAAADLPDGLVDTPDSIIEQVIIPSSGRAFRLTGPELAFYRSMGLPLPREHYEDRLIARLKRLNPRALYQRACFKCNAKIESSFAPQRSERVLCASCYQQQVL